MNESNDELITQDYTLRLSSKAQAAHRILQKPCKVCGNVESVLAAERRCAMCFSSNIVLLLQISQVVILLMLMHGSSSWASCQRSSVGHLTASGVMVRKCLVCNLRARDDGSCKNPACSQHRKSQTGGHWHGKRIAKTLGDVAHRLGAFVAGSFIFSLQHRHDIRVGIASGMFLKDLVSDRTTRLCLLAIVHPCYWRWSTSMVLDFLAVHIKELSHADNDRFADLAQEAWDAMEKTCADYQVVACRSKHEVHLMLRTEAKLVKDCFRYHPYQNPASRRTGAMEVRSLIEDIRSGSLWRACRDLALSWSHKPTYAESRAVLRRHQLKLWSGDGATYACTRFLVLS